MLARNVTLTLGVLSLLVGLALSYVWLFGAPSTRAPVVPVVATQAILVAARPIPVGTLLRSEDFAWSEISQAAVVGTDMVRGRTSETEFLGAVTRQPFRKGEPLVANALVKPGSREFLVAALAPGYRAVSIAVNPAQGVSGLMLPGDHVDVVLTQNFNLQGGGDPRRRTLAETVLRNLRIIAVDQTVTANTRPAEPRLSPVVTQPRVPTTITLEATEEQAQKLLVADQLGKIQLTLRGLPEIVGVSPPREPVPPTWASDVSPALDNLGTAAAAPAGQGPIEVMHGAKTELRCVVRGALVACK